MSQIVTFFIITIITLLLSQPIDVASALEKCSLQDSVCLTNQARMVLKPLVEGDPEKGIEKLDKMSIDYIEVKKNGLIYNMKDLEVEGLKNADIENVSVNFDLKAIGISFRTSLIITGAYTARGVFFTVPVFGDGEFKIQFNDTKFEMLFAYDIVKNKEGYEVVNLTKYIYGFNVIGGIHYHYENVYNNDKEKTEILHSFLNGYTTIMGSRFGDYYMSRIVEKIFTGMQTYLASCNLKFNFAPYYLSISQRMDSTTNISDLMKNIDQVEVPFSTECSPEDCNFYEIKSLQPKPQGILH